MKPNPNQVQKMLSPEETSLLQDVMAGLNALLMSNNAGPMEEAVEGAGAVEMEDNSAPKPPPVETPGEEEEAQKGDDPNAEKSSDGPNANDKAEDRTEDGTEITEDNLASVAKAILQMSKKNTVKKAKSSTDAAQVASIVLKALTPVINKIGTVEKDMNNMLEAMGFAEAMDTVEKSINPLQGGQAVQKSQSIGNPAPVTNPDSMELIKMIGASVAQELMKEEDQHSVVGGPKYSTESTEARKELGSAFMNAFKANKGV